MQWQSGRRSENIEDRRGISPGIAVGGGLGTVILVLAALFFGIDPSVVLQNGDGSSYDASPRMEETRRGRAPAADDQLKEFVSVVLADTEDTWRELFRRMN